MLLQLLDYYMIFMINLGKIVCQKHGFVHAQEALNNANKYFPQLLNEKSQNAILRHMFPLNIRPPKYKESWIITLSDKLVSMEILLHPTFFLYLFKRKGKF